MALLGGKPHADTATYLDQHADPVPLDERHLDLTRRPVSERFTGCGCMTCESDQ